MFHRVGALPQQQLASLYLMQCTVEQLARTISLDRKSDWRIRAKIDGLHELEGHGIGRHA